MKNHSCWFRKSCSSAERFEAVGRQRMHLRFDSETSRRLRCLLHMRGCPPARRSTSNSGHIMIARCLTVLSVILTSATLSAQDGSDPAEVFKRLDKNSDGKITPSEVGKEQGKYFDRLVRLGDKNDDGDLTRDEFDAALKPRAPAAGSGLPGSTTRQPRRQAMDIGAFFDRFDANKDGKLEKTEIPEQVRGRFTRVFERLRKDSITKDELREASRRGMEAGRRQNAERQFQYLDTDKDGKLTVEEVPERGKRTIAMILRRLGKPADGSLTKEEFTKAVAAFNQQQSGSRVPALVRVLDTNRDGKLSLSELEKAKDRFEQLDRNGDGKLDLREVMGFGQRD